MSETKGVEAVERALSILDCFEPGQERISLSDIAEKTGFYKSTILRLAISLERFGYLIRQEDGLFRLGPSLWRLGSLYEAPVNLEALIRPELKRLCSTLQETASFYVREGSDRLCLYREEPTRSIRHSIDEGVLLPLDRGASGRLLLAFSDISDERNSDLRALGFAVSKGERDKEVASVAVPLFGQNGSLAGVLSMSGLIHRFDDKAVEQILVTLQESQKRLSGHIV